jgi:hypothetical protein
MIHLESFIFGLCFAPLIAALAALIAERVTLRRDSTVDFSGLTEAIKEMRKLDNADSKNLKRMADAIEAWCAAVMRR